MPERWTKSAARFDRKKLDWLNGQHIRLLDPAELQTRLMAVLQRSGIDTTQRDAAWFATLTDICREKLSTLNQIVELSDFFFHDITEYEEKPVQKIWRTEDAAAIMEKLTACMAGVDTWDRDVLKQAFHDLGEAMGVGMGKLVHPARLALTGKSVGPGLFELAELLGKEACLARMKNASAYVATL